MKKTIVLLLALMMAVSNASAWGDLGHAAIACVADNHLSPKAKAALDKYLGGLPLAAVASDADKYRREWVRDFGVEICNPAAFRLKTWPDFDYNMPTNIEPWTHSMLVDANFKPFRTDLRQTSRGVEGLNNCSLYIERFIKEFREGIEGMDPYERSVKLRMIVHWLGDMHCPMHMQYDGLDTKKGGKKIRLGENGKEYTLHKFWDGGVFVTTSGMKFSDLARIVDDATPEEMAEIVKGDIWTYAYEAARDSWEAHMYNGKKFIDYEENVVIVPSWYPVTMRPLMMHQIRNAGYRLAAIMNAIFE